MILYHGTSEEDAERIRREGVSIECSYGGYFGCAFYVTPDLELARVYAECSDGEAAILLFEVEPDERWLDLTKPEHWNTWRASGLADRCSDPEIASRACAAGIAAVYDRSMDGWAVYDVATLRLV